jgi:hypothetical protein
VDAVAAAGEANVNRKHGILLAYDVGVGKSRIAAGIALDWLSQDHANRILLTTKGENNIQDLIREFNIVGGGKFPFSIVQVKAFKEVKKDVEADIPKQDKAVYVVDLPNLAPYTPAIRRLGIDALIGDEAHLFSNVQDQTIKVAAAWKTIHKDLIQAEGKFVYLTATPATIITDLEYLYGLKEWHLDGFNDWLLRITGNLSAAEEKEFVKATAQGEKRLEELIGSESTEVPQRKESGGFFRSKDTFDIRITAAEQEQIMRELKMDGKYASLDLWRGGVEFKVETVPLSVEKRKRFSTRVKFLRDILASYHKYGAMNKRQGSFGIRQFLQADVKRVLFDMRFERVIELAKESLKRGEQPVISLVSVSETEEEAGNVAASINAINTRLVEKLEDGTFEDAGEIL